MHNYQSRHGRLPPAVVYGKDGKALHSWRVLLLPFLEQGELYDQFRLDEPWDSPHNRRLLVRMPIVYGPFQGGTAAEPHTTFYQVFMGKGAAFEGSEGMRLADDFPDGSSATFLIVEAAAAVPWTKPEDLPYAPDKQLPELGGISKDGFRAAFADGSVCFINKNVSEATLRGLITRNGGEKLQWDW